MRTKRRVLAAKIEAVEGTPEALTADETGLIAKEANYTPDISMLPRDVIMASFSKLPDLAGKKMASIRIVAEIVGRGTAYAANNLPFLSPYLRACGLAEALDVTPASEKVTYTRASLGHPSLTLGFIDPDDAAGAVLKLIAGARGQLKILGKTGEALFADMTFMGAYQAIADGAAITPNISNVNPPQLLASLFTTGGYSPVVQSFEIDLGNKLSGREDLNSASGYKSFVITDGDTRGRMQTEMVKVATHDYYGQLNAGTLGALNVGPIGPAQYNKVQLTAPKQRITSVQETEVEGHMALDCGFQLAMDAGDDEFVLEFS